MILNLFFLAIEETNKYLIRDLFDIRQGKLILNNDPNKEKDEEQLTKESKIKKINVLTLNSINWELSGIKHENLFAIPEPKTIPPPITNKDFIINRVGQTKGCSLLQSDFDFDKYKVIPSHHFLICSPRQIILDKLPFSHAVLEILLNDLITKKNKPDNKSNQRNEKPKSNYITVREIENIEVEIPLEKFNLLKSAFDPPYNIYATSYKNFMISKEDLNNHKLELAKFLKKENDSNKK